MQLHNCVAHPAPCRQSDGSHNRHRAARHCLTYLALCHQSLYTPWRVIHPLRARHTSLARRAAEILFDCPTDISQVYASNTLAARQPLLRRNRYLPASCQMLPLASRCLATFLQPGALWTMKVSHRLESLLPALQRRGSRFMHPSINLQVPGTLISVLNGAQVHRVMAPIRRDLYLA